MRIRSHLDGTLPDHTDPDTIFVFGSNATGEHFGGAARVAHELFGAKWGHVSGLCGQSYAISTMSLREEDPEPAPLKGQIKTFLTLVKAMPNHEFFLTRVGCGIAGRRDEDVVKMFGPALPNINYPNIWVPYLEIPTS